MRLAVENIPLALFDLFDLILRQHQLLARILQLCFTFRFVERQINFTLGDFFLHLLQLGFSFGNLLIGFRLGLHQRLALLLDLGIGRDDLFVDRLEHCFGDFQSLIDQIQLRLRRRNFGFQLG